MIQTKSYLKLMDCKIVESTLKLIQINVESNCMKKGKNVYYIAQRLF